MQSMFRLPWSTESPGDKIMEKATLHHKPRPMPVVEIPSTFMNKIKRKRSDSPEPVSSQQAHAVKKWKGAQGEVKPVATQVDNHLEAAKPESISVNIPTTTMESALTSAQQAIEAQINYEILLKHNELRLIEQELAKCQVSLEQLRRCSLIPFPGTEGLSEDVSRGVGASLQPPSGYTEPRYAAPWGVTDGPYTRHYAKWLISDAKFDSMSERALAQQAHGYFGIGEGRTTRGSFADFGSTSKGRTSRTSTGTLKLPALGETPAPAPKIDPLLHKRSTDGQWVRLYCAQCGHSNFSNTQGFLNHCRIKHNQVFKSHDQAAIACGVPVDINEVGQPVTATEPTSTPATTPAVTFPLPSTPGIVHPLVRTNPVDLAKNVHRDFVKTPRDETKTLPTPNFTNSPSTPYMTALLQKRGFNGDLKGLVDTARSKVDLDTMEVSDDDSTAAPTPISTKPPQLARLPVSAPNAAPASKAPSARPGSKKGNSQSHPRFPLSFPTPVSVHNAGHHMPVSPVDLSPNGVESNPGLVSDHDDDDDEDGDDTHSQPDFIMNDDVVVEDASDVEGVEQRTGSRQGLDGCFQKAEGSRKH